MHVCDLHMACVSVGERGRGYIMVMQDSMQNSRRLLTGSSQKQNLRLFYFESMMYNNVRGGKERKRERGFDFTLLLLLPLL